MNTIDQLKAAHAAATQGEWGVKQSREYAACNSDVLCKAGYVVARGFSSPSNQRTYNELWAECEGNTNLIALMHNALPTLLEAAEALEEFLSHDDEDNPPNYKRAYTALAKLKGSS